jgi:acetolactate synthase small subunit
MHAVETNHPATRIDAWAVNSAHCQAHYQIVAEAEPDVLCRVLNYFALQSLTPEQVMVNRQEDLLHIDIVMGGLSWHRAQVIGEKIRNLISVCVMDLWPADAVGPQAVAAAAR